MRESGAVARSLKTGMRLVVLAAVLSACGSAAQAQCVGDCQGDGSVTINDLILGVNIALGSQPATACPAFQNAQGQVDIAQLIKGVNNALGGCLAESTATATATSPDTPTISATPAASATHTSAATATSTATHTTAAPTATAMQTSASTATLTATGESTATATATSVSTATVTQSPTPSSTPTVTATASATATATVTKTPTETAVPVGELVAGHAAIVSAGLRSVQAVIAAVVAQDTHSVVALQKVSSPVDVGADAMRVAAANMCSVSGTSQRSCMEMGSGNDKSIHLLLDADSCVVAGASGETAQFNGKITLDSNPSAVGTCDPLAFLSGMYQVGDPDAPGGTAPLEVVFRDAFLEPTLTVSAALSGLVSIGIPPPPSCLVATLTLTLEGDITSQLADSSGSPSIQVNFVDSGLTVDMITYNADCVPLSYRLKFNGPVNFTLSEPAPALVITSGEEIVTSFSVDFTDLFLNQHITSGSVTTEISGRMSSDCFGGDVDVATLDSVVVGAGDVCPNAGQLSLTSSAGPAAVTYAGSQVTVVQGGSEKVFPSCLALDLVNCIPQ